MINLGDANAARVHCLILHEVLQIIGPRLRYRVRTSSSIPFSFSDRFSANDLAFSFVAVIGHRVRVTNETRRPGSGETKSLGRRAPLIQPAKTG
jgi:hypothetical protein